MQTPLHWGKRRFWRGIGERFFWQSRAFRTTTEFGAIIEGRTGDRIPSAIYYFGVWEPHLTRFLGDRLRPGDVFIDVGANIGYYSLCASRIVGPTGRVVAIEASESIYASLQRHIEINAATNVRPVRCAVSDVAGELSVFRGPDSNLGSTSTFRTEETSEFEGTVQSAPLGDLLKLEEIKGARLIKIDVEGAEWAVAKGMRWMLGACPADVEIVMEVAPDRLASQGHSASEILEMFRAHGFRAYALENDYSMISYVPPVKRRPIPRLERVTEQTDVVFSRIDRAYL
jgi:FkbM family methyltransferase